MKSITHISKRLLAREWADNIINEINNNPKITSLELKARGLEMARAVDVCEILKRELNLHHSAIKTDTSELISREGNKVKVSEIHITLSKK